MHRVSSKGLLRALERAERAYLLTAVAAILADAEGRIVSTSELLERIYRCGEGEPRSAEVGLRVAIHTLRRQGFRIICHTRRGYSHVPPPPARPMVA